LRRRRGKRKKRSTFVPATARKKKNLLGGEEEEQFLRKKKTQLGRAKAREKENARPYKLLEVEKLIHVQKGEKHLPSLSLRM